MVNISLRIYLHWTAIRKSRRSVLASHPTPKRRLLLASAMRTTSIEICPETPTSNGPAGRGMPSQGVTPLMGYSALEETPARVHAALNSSRRRIKSGLELLMMESISRAFLGGCLVSQGWARIVVPVVPAARGVHQGQERGWWVSTPVSGREQRKWMRHLLLGWLWVQRTGHLCNFRMWLRHTLPACCPTWLDVAAGAGSPWVGFSPGNRLGHSAIVALPTQSCRGCLEGLPFWKTPWKDAM